VRSPLLREPARLEPESKMQGLLSEMLRARRHTDHLFRLVPEGKLFERPIVERHRIAFYLGHLEVFDVNLLLNTPETTRAVEPLDRLFAFGIDPTDGALPTDRPEDWPAIEEIRAYAHDTRDRLDKWLFDQIDQPQSVDTLMRVHASIEHRWMHAETFAYMLHQLLFDRPLRTLPASHRALGDDDLVAIPAGIVRLGRPDEEGGFGWDNEFPTQTVHVPAFQIDRYMVTNAQLLRFLEAGGYENPHYWSKENWHWRELKNVEHPAAWVRTAGDWYLISRADLVPFQGDWPAYVSHAEASAYARWAGKRLPTEAQWQRAAYGEAAGADSYHPWGQLAPGIEHGNFDFQRWDPTPVDAHPQGASSFGVTGLLGNGWEWTRTSFAPYPGFRPYAFYPGYSADFFDGRHFVLKGGSAQTAQRLLRPSFRNWFQPHYAYPFAGFRCVVER
jgi:gamma-glutamyl hercynylcysteine S-oxide synthase